MCIHDLKYSGFSLYSNEVDIFRIATNKIIFYIGLNLINRGHTIQKYMCIYVYNIGLLRIDTLLYGAIEKVFTKIRRRCLKFAGHCLRRDDEVVSDLVIWEPTHGTRRWGKPP